MKKGLLFFVLLLVVQFIKSQERVSRELPTYSNPISVLDESKGWYLNSKTGQWESENKRIGFIFDYFSAFEFRNFHLNGKEYLLLMKHLSDWYYEFPLIEEGYHEYETTLSYVIDKSDFINKINNVTDSTATIQCNILGRYYGIKRLDYPDNFKAEISNIPQRTNSTLVIQYRLYKSQNNARFLIFEQKPNGKFSLGNEKFDKIPSIVRVLKTNNIYKKAYYETSYNNFLDFINLREE